MIWHEFTKDDCNVISDLFLSRAPTGILNKALAKDSIFHLHIPKTGGSFLTKVLDKSNIKAYSPSHRKCNPNIPLYPDPTDAIPRSGVFQDQPGFNESLRVSIIRNPFEWLVSYYFHCHRSQDGLLPWDGALGVGGIRTIYSSFDCFLDAYCNEEMYWPTGLSEFRRFYPFQIFDVDGKCQAHLILKNGQKSLLSNSLICLMSIFGYSPHAFPDEIAKILNKKINASVEKKKDYRSYYTSSQVDLLNKKWRYILDVFGYDFEGSIDNKLILDGKNIQYSFKENKVWKINGS